MDHRGYYLSVGGYGADGGLLIFTHEATVTFDIGTENCGEFTLEVFCCHANISCERWRGQADKSSELEQGKGRSDSEILSLENEWESEIAFIAG